MTTTETAGDPVWLREAGESLPAVVTTQVSGTSVHVVLYRPRRGLTPSRWVRRRRRARVFEERIDTGRRTDRPLPRRVTPLIQATDDDPAASDGQGAAA